MCEPTSHRGTGTLERIERPVLRETQSLGHLAEVIVDNLRRGGPTLLGPLATEKLMYRT